MKQMKINVPEGHEIDTERSELSTGEIYFREKKPEFKVDDWIVRIGKEEYGALKILKSTYGGSRYYQVTGGFGYIIDPDCKHSCGFYRHATPSEIAEAKERLREKELPKRWEDLGKVSGYYTSTYSEIEGIGEIGTDEDTRNTWPTREEAEASIALAQLKQLMKKYNGDWEPDWTNSSDKYVINFHRDVIDINVSKYARHVLVFKNQGLRRHFMINHRSLIETAKPLL